MYSKHMKRNGITEYFGKVENSKKYNEYYYSVSEVTTNVIPGSLCGLKNIG